MTKTLRQLGTLFFLYLGLASRLFARESVGAEWLKGINGNNRGPSILIRARVPLTCWRPTGSQELNRPIIISQ